MLDALESRLLLHATLNTTKHILSVVGAAGVVNDVINITLNGPGTRIIVEHVNDGTAQTFAKSDVKKISVDLKDGDDKLTIESGVGGITLPTTIVGGEGSDVIAGGDGPDNINAGNGRNRVTGNGGDDVLVGGTGVDTFTGGAGNDNINGGGGTNDAVSEAGNVSFSLTNASLTGLGTDQLSGIKRAFLTGGASGNTIVATKFSGYAELDGGGGNDSLRASPRACLLMGGDGNDILFGSTGSDTFTGGLGNDTIHGVVDPNVPGPGGLTDYLVEEGDVNFRLTSTIGSSASLSGLGSDTIDHIALVILTGGSHANTINATGFLGQVTLDGSRGNDKLIGAFGKTTFTGGEGSDVITGSVDQDNTLIETADVNFTLTDSTISGLGNDLFTNIKTLNLRGGPSANTIDATAYTEGVADLEGFGGNDVLRAGPGGSRLNGYDGNDSLVGNDGFDELLPGFGNDTCNGGDKKDKLWDVRDANFKLTNTRLNIGATEFDTLKSVETAELLGGLSANTLDASGFTLGGVTLSGISGNDILRGTNIIGGGGLMDRLSGGDGNDTISGNDGLDELFEGVPGFSVVKLTDTKLTGRGTDTLSGLEAATFFASLGTGTDPIKVDCSAFSEDVHMEGGAGKDTLIGTALNDVINGNGGNDTIEARAGDDVISGGDGDDILKGEDGNDYIDGGPGKDTFYTGFGDNRVIAQDGVAETIFAGVGTVNPDFSTKDLTDQITIII